MGRTIVQLLRPNASNSSLEMGNDVSFEEFVEYLTLPLTTTTDIPYTVNEHWESIVQLCHPCYVKYSIIGKTEVSIMIIIVCVDHYIIFLQVNMKLCLMIQF